MFECWTQVYFNYADIKQYPPTLIQGLCCIHALCMSSLSLSRSGRLLLSGLLTVGTIQSGTISVQVLCSFSFPFGQDKVMRLHCRIWFPMCIKMTRIEWVSNQRITSITNKIDLIKNFAAQNLYLLWSNIFLWTVIAKLSLNFNFSTAPPTQPTLPQN